MEHMGNKTVLSSNLSRDEKDLIIQNALVDEQDGFDECSKYKGIKSKPCCQNGIEQEDDYPSRAKGFCDEFVKMYSFNKNINKNIVCVANCLVAEEIKTQKELSCEKRNALRLEYHVSCYATCIFIPWLWMPDGV